MTSFDISRKSKKKLQRDYQIIVEGKQLICEAVQSHFRLNHLLFSHLDKIQDVVEVMGSSTGNVNFLRVPQQDLNSWFVLKPPIIGQDFYFKLCKILGQC